MSIVERAIAKVAAAANRKTDGADTNRTPRHENPPRPQSKGADAVDGIEQTIDLSTALPDAGLTMPADWDHLLAEELRLIKRPLLLNAESGEAPIPNGNLVMIASALPGAGKTFLSFNIAMSMATELDWKVLLVDADVSRPTLSRALGVGHAPGLVGLLESDDGRLADFTYKTTRSSLYFLPAGAPRTQNKELLGSQRMRGLIADLAARNDRFIVVFDSPPLLLTSEARVIASYVGQIGLVVEAGVTPRRSVLEAIELLDPGKPVNLILNKNRQTFGMGDYHYSGYGAYGPVAERPRVE